MSKETNVIDDMIEQKLLSLHTGFPAKVVSIKGRFATVQPLAMIKQIGKEAKKQALVSNIPICNSARFKLEWIDHENTASPNAATITFSDAVDEPTTQDVNIILQTKKVKHLSAKPLEVGDIVFCACGERDITETKKGSFSTPSLGHHEIKDAIIIAILD